MLEARFELKLKLHSLNFLKAIQGMEQNFTSQCLSSITSGPPSLSIIIPARNEAQRLPKTIAQLQDFFRYHPWTLEIIPVIQGNDETISLICELAKKDPRIKPLIDPQGRGKGRAVRCGVERAQGEIILFIDADLNVPPHCLARLLEQFQSTPPCDILIGSRRHPQSKIIHPQPWHRQLLNGAFNFLLRSWHLTKFRDTQCGCKLFRRDVAKVLFSYSMVNGFAFDVEILVLAKNFGYQVAEAPVEWADTSHSHFKIFRDGLQSLEDAWNLTEYRS
ncbi:MAG: glycosyltransferase family 2 protein [Verrucomicrobia bacterium]|nr:glycosyltransferase family 2 protein [Verrucomicrobiota bacterium]